MTTHYLKKDLIQSIHGDPEALNKLQEWWADGVFCRDLDRPENEWISPRFWQLLGFDPKEKNHLASERRALIHPDDLASYQRALDDLLTTPELHHEQVLRYRDHAGRTRWLRCRCWIITADDGHPTRLIGAHHDVTPYLRAQEQSRDAESKTLEEQRRQTQKLEAFSRFADGAARDFNNQLTVIIGFTDLALSIAEDKAIRDLLEQVACSAKKSTDLTRQLMTYGHALVLQPTDLSLETHIARAEALLTRLIREELEETPSSRAPQAPPSSRVHTTLPLPLTALVVEDDEKILRFAQMVLTSHGFEVILARNGQEALTLIQQQSITSMDLLLTDVIMPEINGEALAESLRETFPDIRVIFMSGYPPNTVLRHGTRARNTAFIAKPFSALDLIGEVHSALAIE